jgi:hypothetical protein
MASDDANPNAEAFLALLREDAGPVPPATRARLGSRLARVAAGAPGLAPSATAPPAGGFWRAKAGTALLVLPLGVLLGAAGHGWLAAKEMRPPRRLAALELSLKPAVSRAPQEPSSTSLPVASTPVPVVPTPAPAQSLRGTKPRSERTPVIEAAPPSLRDDVSLLERARTAFAEGDAAGSLERLTLHQRRFPASALRQEREALEIKVLLALGRTVEGKRLAAAFLERYPRSSLRGAVARAVGKNP